MQQVVKWMLWKPLFAAIHAVLIHMQRQPGDRLGKDSDTGVHRRGLQRGMLIDHFAGGRAAKQEGERAAQAVLGLIAGVKELTKGGFHRHTSGVWHNKRATFRLLLRIETYMPSCSLRTREIALTQGNTVSSAGFAHVQQIIRSLYNLFSRFVRLV